ncbi:MAG: hypothetical protein KC502_21370 [Myxococcales bacterium]|nr:hypothetical protein [Myxococcales bacterium]
MFLIRLPDGPPRACGGAFDRHARWQVLLVCSALWACGGDGAPASSVSSDVQGAGHLDAYSDTDATDAAQANDGAVHSDAMAADGHTVDAGDVMQLSDAHFDATGDLDADASVVVGRAPSDANAAANADVAASHDGQYGDGLGLDGQPTDAPAAAKSCFVGGPPGPADAVLVPPEPSTALCPAAGFWSGQTKPASLALQLGTTDPKSGFKSWGHGTWAPIVHGPQGGIHIELSVRFKLPGLQAALVLNETFKMKAIVNHGCKSASTPSTATLKLKADKFGVFGARAGGAQTMMVVFPVTSAQSGLYCGPWLVVHMYVQHPKTGAWGFTHQTIRMYDT